MEMGKMYKEEWRDWRRHPDFKGNNRYLWQKMRNEQKKFYSGMTPEAKLANH